MFCDNFQELLGQIDQEQIIFVTGQDGKIYPVGRLPSGDPGSKNYQLTLERAQLRIDEIKAVVGDLETAHILRDRLYADALRSVANGWENSRELARAILAVDFIGWCS